MSKVSIIIPTKDRAVLLAEAIASVRAQTHANWEAIVVDDHSSDGTPAVLHRIAADDQRVRVFTLTHQSGAPAGRNEGVRRSTGEFVIFLDDDDLLAPHCLTQRVEVMRSAAAASLDFAVFPCQVFVATPGDTPLLWNADTGEDDLDRFINGDVPWQTTSPIWRRAALDKVGPWDEEARSAQDWEFHIRAIVAGLKYERFQPGPPDCFWRRPSAERDSIGKSAIRGNYVRGRVAVIGKMATLVQRSGLMTERRRLLFAASYFRAAERMAQNTSRAQARELWTSAYRTGVISRRRHLTGLMYFYAFRSPALRRVARRMLATMWPAELLSGRPPLLNFAPMNPPPSSSPAPSPAFRQQAIATEVSA